jgi:two-component system cell cycle sensor histidine kinase/response regulator CckA
VGVPLKERFALAVDDEPTDLENLSCVLADAGYHVLTARDANTAIDIFQAHSGNIELLVTDVAMSPVNGCDLAAQLLKFKPDLRVVFVSGYSGSLAFQYSDVPVSHFAFLAKPFSPVDLLEKITPVKEKVFSAGSAGSPEA